jgi:MFS family permease
MIPLGFFRKPAFSISSLVVLMVGVAMFGVIYFITLYFQNIHGYSPQQAGLRSLPLTAMVVLVAPIAGRLNTKVGPRPLMTIGMAGMALGLLGLAQIGVDTNYLYLIPLFLLMGAGISMTMPSVTSAAMGSVDPTKAGIASGVVNSSRQVGGALGVAVFGSIAATLASDSWSNSIAKLPTAAHAGAEHLTQLVIGGQTAKIAAIAGARGGPAAAKVASDNAATAFMHGFHGAMYLGAAMATAASITAFVGLRNVRVRQPQEQQSEQPMAAVEM